MVLFTVSATLLLDTLAAAASVGAINYQEPRHGQPDHLGDTQARLGQQPPNLEVAGSNPAEGANLIHRFET